MSFLETRMPMTEKTMNEVLRARIEDRIKELQEGLNQYNGKNADGSDAGIGIYYIRPTYSPNTVSFYRSVPAIIEELKNLLK
jgi:hypothetical protein